MSPEEIALKTISEGKLSNHFRDGGKFCPVLMVNFDESRFTPTSFSIYNPYQPASNTAYFDVRIKYTDVFVTLRRENFTPEEWVNIPKKLKKGLTRLHEKGNLIPIIKAQMLL